MIMNKKIIKNYIYTGLGYPIELHDVEVVQFENESYPKIDIKEISDLAIKSLISQNSRFTGNQIKFIRAYFDMSLREFSTIVNESHMAVKKWEDFKDKPTNMDRNIEIMLRLHIFNKVFINTKNNQKNKIEFYNQFVSLTEMFCCPEKLTYKLLSTTLNEPPQVYSVCYKKKRAKSD